MIPLKVGSTVNAVEVNSELLQKRPPRILLIDDDPFSYETVEAQLFQDGYELLFRNNGMDAVHQVSTLHPDLILLDLMMPGISGFEVCQQLKIGLLKKGDKERVRKLTKKRN